MPPRDSAPAPAGPPGEAATPPAAPRAEPTATPVAGPRAEPAEEEAAPRPARKPRRADVERGLRGIVGAGPSQVGVVGSMRARDAAKPTAADLAAAEREVVVVRRHYVPPDALPGAR